MALGLFDERYAGTDNAEGIETAEDVALARRAAARSIVLLANDGTLPLEPGSRVAVLGPSAADTRRLYGDYSYPGRSIHIGADQVVEEVVAPTDLRRIARRVPTPREALSERYEVVDDVDGADVAVVFVGGRSGMSEEDTSGEFRDASDLRLPPEQLELIAATAASGVPTVVVVIGGRAHSLTEVVPHAAALVMAWLPGDEGARGLVDVLAGDVDAGGRLPVSLLRTVGQVGAYAGHHHGGGRSLIYGDYVDGPVSPLFPFGHGLSYTTWSYDEVAVVAGSTTEEIRDRRRAHEHGRSQRRGGHPDLRARRGGLRRRTRPSPGRVPAGDGCSRRNGAHSLHDPRHRARVPRRRPPVPGGTRRRHLSRRPDVDHGDGDRRGRAPRSQSRAAVQGQPWLMRF